MTDRKPTARDFPLMRTMAEAREISRLASRAGHTQVYQPCSVCRLAISPRNRARHAKACARRKRLAPGLWAEWCDDMNGRGYSDQHKRVLRALRSGPLYRPTLELVLAISESTSRKLTGDLLRWRLVEIARDIGPATYQLTKAGQQRLEAVQ